MVNYICAVILPTHVVVTLLAKMYETYPSYEPFGFEYLIF